MVKEVKAQTGAMKTLNAELMATFEAYKQTNDQRLNELEQASGADPLLVEKLNKMDQRLDQLSLKMARPAEPNEPSQPLSQNTSWRTYLRQGVQPPLSGVEMKALNRDDDQQGGVLAPPELDRLIESRLMQRTQMRQIARIRQTTSSVYRKPVSQGAGASWVGETEARPETDLNGLELIEFPAGELYAMPAATQTLLEDAYADLEEWLADEVETTFSLQESAAFVTGDGQAKPRGFLTYETVPDAAHEWGKLGSIPGDFTLPDAGDQLIDLIHTPQSAYRRNGRFVMNRRTAAVVRKLKDGEGRYLWAPSTAGENATILGHPVTELEDMPDIGADQAAIAFGDFQRFYLIVDRQGTRVLRDPYSAKPYVLFYTTKRVGGGVQNFDAVKLMVF